MNTVAWQEWGLRGDPPVRAPDPRFLDVAGTPGEQGEAHGWAARTAIEANVAAVRRDVAALCPHETEREHYRALLAANAEFVRDQAPDAWEELAGIARGAGVGLDDVLALNLPAHMVMHFVPAECSQVAVTGARAAGGRTLVAKTRDMPGDFVEHVVLRRRYPDGRRLVEVTVAGSVLWPGSGLSDAGVAMSTSGVWSRHTAVDWRDVRAGWILINSHDLLRRAGSAGEFVDLLRGQPRLSGLNMVVADPVTTLGLEVTRDGIVPRPGGDTQVLTNHYASTPLAGLSRTRAEYPSTYARADRAGEILAGADDVTVADLAALCADEQGGPQDSIARRLVDGAGAETTYASIAVLPDLEFHVVLGNPADATGVRS